jgi:hypothetical protein
VNQWRNEPSSRDQLGHHLAFTKGAQEPTLAANEPTLIATSSQTAPWAYIPCIQSPEVWIVRKKLDASLIWTHSVHFKHDYPDINVWRKGPF